MVLFKSSKYEKSFYEKDNYITNALRVAGSSAAALTRQGFWPAPHARR
jgi:hypothetical protein